MEESVNRVMLEIVGLKMEHNIINGNEYYRNISFVNWEKSFKNKFDSYQVNELNVEDPDCGFQVYIENKSLGKRF